MRKLSCQFFKNPYVSCIYEQKLYTRERNMDILYNIYIYVCFCNIFYRAVTFRTEVKIPANRTLVSRGILAGRVAITSILKSTRAFPFFQGFPSANAPPPPPPSRAPYHANLKGFARSVVRSPSRSSTRSRARELWRTAGRRTGGGNIN